MIYYCSHKENTVSESNDVADLFDRLKYEQ